MTYRKIFRSFAATLEHLQTHAVAPDSLLTMETISFQYNDKFGVDMEVILNQIKDMVDAGANHKAIKNSKDLLSKLESLVKARLGIKMKLITDENLAGVIPNVYVPHNPVIQDDLKRIYEFILDGKSNPILKVKHNKSLGTVNTEKAKITGWFSEQELPLFMNFIGLFRKYKMTVPEVAAILLHELGHAFEAIVFSSNVNMTNQVLADIARHITDKPKDIDVNYVYAKLKSVDKEATLDMAEAIASGDRVVMSVATYRIVAGLTNSLMSDTTYNSTTYEALSDNFAVKFGYGVAVVTGLEKLEDSYSEFEMYEEMYNVVKDAMWFTGLLSVTYGVFSILFLVAKSKIGLSLFFGVLSYMFGALFNMLLNTQRTSTKDMTYDNIKDRYGRVRSTMVEYIKKDSLSITTRETILGQIKMIDEIISKKKIFTSPIGEMALKVFPSDRRAQESIKAQQEMEKLIANDVFISANKLMVTGSKS